MYLAALIKLQGEIAGQPIGDIHGWVTNMITSHVAAIDRKAADLEVSLNLIDQDFVFSNIAIQKFLSQSHPPSPFAVRSVGLRDNYLDIDGNVKPLYLSLNVATGEDQYHIVDSNGRTTPYWSKFAIIPQDIRIVVYAGQRIILDPGHLPAVYNKAYFVEMLSPAAAEAFLHQLSSLNLKIATKNS